LSSCQLKVFDYSYRMINQYLLIRRSGTMHGALSFVKRRTCAHDVIYHTQLLYILIFELCCI